MMPKLEFLSHYTHTGTYDETVRTPSIKVEQRKQFDQIFKITHREKTTFLLTPTTNNKVNHGDLSSRKWRDAGFYFFKSPSADFIVQCLQVN